MEADSRAQTAAIVARDAQEFESERRRLTLLAYRLCGSWADAEDIVQQVAIEWLRAPAPIVNPGGWLTKVAVRRALDRLRSRQRDADYVGPWLPEPLATSALPHEHLERTDALSTAFLLLAEHLTPPQRAVVVLRSLDYSHPEIASILDITPAASRQHHTRGTRRLADLDGRGIDHDSGLGPTSGVDHSETAGKLLRSFLVAAREGDLDALTALLHEDVRAFQDGGGKVRSARRVLVGVPNVARFAIGVASLHEHRRSAQPMFVNGAPGAVLTLSDVTHVLSLEVRGGRIYRLFDVCNPDKLHIPSIEARSRLAEAG